MKYVCALVLPAVPLLAGAQPPGVPAEDARAVRINGCYLTRLAAQET